MDSLGDEQYVQVTTFKRDGTEVGTPVWPVDTGDGRIAFVTPKQGGKTKRLRNDPRITLQPSDFYGTTLDGSSPSAGTAEIVTDAEYERIFALVLAKYGQQAWDNAMKSAHAYFAEHAGGYDGDVAVVVTLAD